MQSSFTRSHDAVVKFDTYRNLQRHRAVIPAIAWLSWFPKNQNYWA